MTISAGRTRFEFIDPALPIGTANLTGVWTSAVQETPEALAFMTEREPDISRWRIDFPAEIGEAVADLTRAEADLTVVERAVGDAEARLTAFIADLRPAMDAGLAFDLPALEEPVPEQTLRGLLLELQIGPRPESFGLGEIITEWPRAAEEFQIFIRQLAQAITFYAWVETRIEGQLVSHTVVSWSGNMMSAWSRGISADHVTLHSRTLALALTSRDALLRVLIVAAQGAVRLATVLTLPFGPFMALPAVFKFVDQVLEEYRKYNQTKEAITNG